jgi:PAS domain S-box-containing protein
MHIRWNLIITALCLGLLFCVADAYLDGVIYAERGFFPQLFYPLEQELIYRIQTFLFICLFAGYAWHQSNAQERLKVSLEEAMAAFKSERARAESVLAAIETSMDGIAILNGAEEYIYLNESHAAIYGYESPSELIGKSWHALYNEQERERLQPLIYEGFAARRGWRGVATGLKKDGSEFPQEISLSLLDDGGLICVVRDISKRKSREEAIRLLNENLQQQALDLQATNRELEAFSYSLSHDLRSPLTRIYMSAQALEDMYGEGFDETGKRLLHLICTGCESMEAFIGAMLVLFRVTRSEISCCEVDLSALAGEIMAEIRLQQADRQIEWVTAPGLVAWCDPQLMRILLENLLQNAWKFSTCTEHACIEFGSSESDGVRAFFVCDNGAGFSMTEVERLFKPFQRLHCSNDIPGTGIGLATVQRIVERHGGRVWGEGIVDGGATFYFTLGRSELLESEPGAKEN